MSLLLQAFDKLTDGVALLMQGTIIAVTPVALFATGMYFLNDAYTRRQELWSDAKQKSQRLWTHKWLYLRTGSMIASAVLVCAALLDASRKVGFGF